jgi:hypothetical protein
MEKLQNEALILSTISSSPKAPCQQNFKLRCPFHGWLATNPTWLKRTSANFRQEQHAGAVVLNPDFFTLAKNASKIRLRQTLWESSLFAFTTQRLSKIRIRRSKIVGVIRDAGDDAIYFGTKPRVLTDA